MLNLVWFDKKDTLVQTLNSYFTPMFQMKNINLKTAINEFSFTYSDKTETTIFSESLKFINTDKHRTQIRKKTV